jgi:hypothetical protein
LEVEAIASVLAYVTIIECRPAGRSPPLSPCGSMAAGVRARRRARGLCVESSPHFSSSHAPNQGFNPSRGRGSLRPAEREAA